MRFRKVAMGGTFHRIHKGHRALFREAFKVGREVIVGLSSDSLVRSRHKSHDIHPYFKRRARVIEFFEKEGLLKRAKIVPLEDPYGPTIWDEDIEAIVVSEETKSTAVRINEIRKKRGLDSLKILVINRVQAENGGLISTSRILRGEIDEEGRLLDK